LLSDLTQFLPKQPTDHLDEIALVVVAAERLSLSDRPDQLTNQADNRALDSAKYCP